MTRPGRPKKRLGQHFLRDPNTARIVAGGITPEDVVLEIGAGRGFLTAFLAERARLVHAVELDRDLIQALYEAVRDCENVVVHRADALRMNYSALRPLPDHLAANLPYNIASPLVLRLLEEATFIGRMRFMVQLEVARRMTSHPGSKDYAAYAVLVQLLGEASIVHRVPPSVFEPPPRVWSAVVEVRRREMPRDYAGLKNFVLAAFSSRRKRLVNNLPREVRGRAEMSLRGLGRRPDTRAEELTPEELAALYRSLGDTDGLLGLPV